MLTYKMRFVQLKQNTYQITKKPPRRRNLHWWWNIDELLTEIISYYEEFQYQLKEFI